jgi:hypothetical protein
LTRKTYAQSEASITFSSTQAQAIRGDRANGLTQRIAIWIADAHRDDGKRFVVRADEKLTAFVELESVIWACGELS